MKVLPNKNSWFNTRSAIFLIMLFVILCSISCQTNKNTTMKPIQYIPEIFHDIKLGYYESGINSCTPYYPNDPCFILLNEIAINAPQKIICNIKDSGFIPIIPICGFYVITLRRCAKYNDLAADIIHIRKKDEDIWYTGEMKENTENEYPILPPGYEEAEIERQKEIEEAQKYNLDDLNEGQASSRAININLLEYINMPFLPGNYEIYMSSCGLESNHVEVEIVIEN